MEVKADYVSSIVELAKEIDKEDPIDWGNLSVSEDEAYQLMASSIVEQMFDKYGKPGSREVILATLVHLVVENFTLNLKLKGHINGS